MTLVRRLALKVSGLVVRFASAGCKQWAEGSLQETEHIESDWAALEWALGSTRVLLDRREAPFRSMTEALTAADQFIAKKQELVCQPGYPALILIQSFFYALKFFGAQSSTQRIGFISVVVSSLCLFLFLSSEKRRLKLALAVDIEDPVLFYQAELKRSLDMPLGSRFPVFGIFWLLYVGGLALSQRGPLLDHSICNSILGAVVLLVIALTLHKRHVDQRRLASLEALQSVARDWPNHQ